MPSSYIILGADGSGRREVLCDLIRSTRADRTGVNAIYISEDERSSPHDEALRALDNTTLLSWRFQSHEVIASESLPNDTDTAFFVFDGLLNPVDQIEALKPWLELNNLTLARILSVVHCRLAFENPALAKWYEACIHFSDYVLLNRRTGVPNRWMRKFQDYYKKHRYPCPFEFVRKGKVPNPEQVLYPETRRLSLFFDDLENASSTVDTFGNIVIQGDLPYEEDEVGTPHTDPYLARYSDGPRRKPIPDIRKYLEARS